MKKLLLLAFAIGLFSSEAWANVFVICDPYLTTDVQPTHFSIVMDGQPPVDTPALVQADQTVILHYDVTNVSNGNHSMTVKAVKIDPIWGRLESPASPFDFIKQGISGTPSGIKLRKE